jgi:hypothetical protein
MGSGRELNPAGMVMVVIGRNDVQTWLCTISMPSDGDSFLPRIESVFYAVFDIRQGPKIVHQVPEDLITTSVQTAYPSLPPTPSSETAPALPYPPLTSRNSSNSINSPTDFRPSSRPIHSPHKRSISSTRVLFNFDDISKYVIPPSPLCGSLVTCSTKNHRIIGLPVQLRHAKYPRNYFRYNICFVFERYAPPPARQL